MEKAKTKEKHCKHCKRVFTPKFQTQDCCTYKCYAILYGYPLES